MPRFVIRLTDELVSGIGEVMNLNTADGLFGEMKFVMFTFTSETEFTAKLMTEDELVEEVKNDSNVQVLM